MCRPKIHYDPKVSLSRSRSLFNTPCGLEAFLKVPNGKMAHPELSGDFSSGHPFSEQSQSPPTPSCRVTSHPDIPSLSNPKAHLWSSVLSLRLGGMFAEALISALWIHPCLPNHAWVALMLLSACACIIHASFLPGHCCQVETAKVRQTHHEFYTYRRHLCWLLLNCSVCKTESGM